MGTGKETQSVVGGLQIKHKNGEWDRWEGLLPAGLVDI